jgi:hypothetical protein
MPSRYYKILIPVLVFIAAVGVTAVAGYSSVHTTSPVITTASVAPSSAVTTTTAAIQPRAVQKHEAPVAPRAQASSSSVTSTAISPSKANATFIVGDKKYSVAITASESIDDAMRALAAQNSSFSFTEKSYPGLGQYVDTINGKASGNGYYWFLYVNGKVSNTGVSSTHLAPGDTVEWRYDRSY